MWEFFAKYHEKTLKIFASWFRLCRLLIVWGGVDPALILGARETGTKACCVPRWAMLDAGFGGIYVPKAA
ncbi:hypothetical protein CSC3H3_06650 [Thalassospira marina]|uniref:Uncharacterized protein n=1 Tax=Thalassospira marina TaxID=2048283 RepID=A0A2N3KSJ9_9PROT|nr:hypothetical protein CSC3H3_06650 [Thalassospira marina]PKR53453.1 hypothetical protein COO20_15330 [Thalassospira marina]